MLTETNRKPDPRYKGAVMLPLDMKPIQGPNSSEQRDLMWADYRSKLYQTIDTARSSKVPEFSGKGIVVPAGGPTYFVCAYVQARMLRDVLDCTLPIEWWFLGKHEMDEVTIQIAKELGITCINAYEHRLLQPCRILNGWELNPYAILHSKFDEVMFLDADNLPLNDPAEFFEWSKYKEFNACFWPDYGRLAKNRSIWNICGVPYNDEPEFESGQILLKKSKVWTELQATMHLNEHSDFYYQHVWGDKETYHMAWKACGTPYGMCPTPIEQLPARPKGSLVMCQHDFQGYRIFQHRNLDKFRLNYETNLRIPGFQYEAQCFEWIRELQQKWDGTIKVTRTAQEQEATVAFLENPIRNISIGMAPHRVIFKPNGSVEPHQLITSWRIEDTGGKLELVLYRGSRILAKLSKGSSHWFGQIPTSSSLVVIRD